MNNFQSVASGRGLLKDYYTQDMEPREKDPTKRPSSSLQLALKQKRDALKYNRGM